MALEIRNIAQLCCDRQLQVVPRQPLVKRQCFEIGRRHGVHVVEVGVVNARTRPIGRGALIERFTRRLLAVGFDPLHDQIRLRQQTKIVGQPLCHPVDRSTCRVEIRRPSSLGVVVTQGLIIAHLIEKCGQLTLFTQLGHHRTHLLV